MSEKNRPWGIHMLRDMIGGANCSTKDSLGCWVRAVPLPYYPNIPGRIVTAWWVLTGRAHAVIWPEPGELERALASYAVRKIK